MAYININGKIYPSSEASVSHDNRAFRYGYGVFETILVRDGAIQLKDYHWERLFAGLQKLHFTIPKLMTPQWLESEVLQTVEKNGLEALCRVRLQMYAGSGGLYDGRSQKPEYIIECFPLEQRVTELNENGLVVGIAANLSKSPDSLANLKTCNALIYVMAAQQAKENKWNDALICNTKGNVIESTIANIFWVKGGILYTPPLTDGCVAGAMRRHIMSKTAVVEKSLSEQELYAADEVFLTNSIRGVKWVQRIGEALYICNFSKNAVPLIR